MQVKKEEIKDKIINSAIKEFLNCGYSKASLRVIAEKAGLTKGALYAYFKNKDDLFCKVTEPAVSFIESEFKYDISDFTTVVNEDCLDSFNCDIECFKNYALAVLDNYKSFKLLLFCSAGSSLQDYKERIIHLYSQNFYSRFLAVRKVEVSEDIFCEMFVHTLANTYVSFLEELVLHEPNKKQVDDYVLQMAIFLNSGFKKLYFHQIS